MKERTPIDEMRALAAGSLTSEEEGRLRARCEADPGLRGLLEEVLEVFALTEPGDVEIPPCRLEFEGVLGALAPHRARRAVLRRLLRVAVAVLVLVVGAFLLSRVIPDESGGGEAGRELVLKAIPLDAEEPSGTGPEIPGVLAGYRPVEGNAIRWIHSFGTALAAARVSSRPVLLFLYHPTCPACRWMEEHPFSDPRVREIAEHYVPARISVLTAPPEIRKLAREGWPWLGVLDPDGATVLAFPGTRNASGLLEHLRKAGELVHLRPRPWKEVAALVRRLAAARGAEEEGRYGTALAGYRALDRENAPGPIRAAARGGRRRVALRARDALLAAKDMAETPEGVPAAVEALDEAIASFRDTPFAGDLRSVRETLARTGRFPRLR